MKVPTGDADLYSIRGVFLLGSLDSSGRGLVQAESQLCPYEPVEVTRE